MKFSVVKVAECIEPCAQTILGKFEQYFPYRAWSQVKYLWARCLIDVFGFLDIMANSNDDVMI